MRSDHEEISAVCLKHLRREEEVLRDKRDTLERIHDALVGAELDGLHALHETQEEAAHVTGLLREQRDQFREQVGTLLQLPSETVTVRQVVAAIPEKERGSVREVWTRLLELAAEVERLNRCNAVLIDYCLGFTQSYLLDITGGGRPAERYGPAGTHLEASCGSLLEARG